MFIMVIRLMRANLAHCYHHGVIRHVQFNAIVKIIRQLNVRFAAVERRREHFWDLGVVQRSLYRGAHRVEKIPTALQNLQKTRRVT